MTCALMIRWHSSHVKPGWNPQIGSQIDLLTDGLNPLLRPNAIPSNRKAPVWNPTALAMSASIGGYYQPLNVF